MDKQKLITFDVDFIDEIDLPFIEIDQVDIDNICEVFDVSASTHITLLDLMKSKTADITDVMKVYIAVANLPKEALIKLLIKINRLNNRKQIKYSQFWELDISVTIKNWSDRGIAMLQHHVILELNKYWMFELMEFKDDSAEYFYPDDYIKAMMRNAKCRLYRESMREEVMKILIELARSTTKPARF